MREVLQNLNAVSGMKGSLVVAPDGLPIALNLPSEIDAETVAGLGACMGEMLADWAGEINAGGISVCMLEAEGARFFISAISWGYLVAVAEKRCPLGEARLEMRAAAAKLNEICERLSRSMQTEENSTAAPI
jgi:predicted regulator of Ras-like GTPase activity (Roadblock/LC7/MglB family)